MLTFVCLKARPLYSSQYVNILKDMVFRNTAEGTFSRFVCVTDDPEGLDEDIEVIKLPPGLIGWWGKLYLFKKDLFAKGERIVYMDLDTVITGRLDGILAYEGKFAVLRDFYHHSKMASGIMLWEAGTQDHIWDAWCLAGMPEDDKGDGWWIGQYQADFIQDLFQGKIVSYKKDCLVAPPVHAAIICFHGLPRPHQVEGWVKDFWKKDGYSSSDYDVVCNVELEKVTSNIRYSSNLDLPWLELKPEVNRKVLLCGGGPSIKDDIEEIRQEAAKGSYIVGLNNSAQYLKSKGISVDCMMMIDSRESNLKFIESDPAREYFIASQVSGKIFDKLPQEKITLFHIDIPNIGEYVPGNRPIQAVGGGSTVGLMAMCIAYTQGYRDIHLYGFDSSYKEDEGHAYAQVQQEEAVEAVVMGRKFKTTPWMVTQTNQFQLIANQLRALNCDITVHGSGLLPYVAWCASHQIQEAA